MNGSIPRHQPVAPPSGTPPSQPARQLDITERVCNISGMAAAHRKTPRRRGPDPVKRAVLVNSFLQTNGISPSAPVIAVYSRAVLATPSARVLRRRMPDDAEETAHQLFAVLREFDAQGVKLIWVEELPASPEWDGVRDRLQRAAA